MPKRLLRLLQILLLSAACGGAARAQSFVVTTTMLESAPDDAFDGLRVQSLIPPGNCPGHFDLKPRMLAEIRDCDLFLYHHYQRGVEARIVGMGIETEMLVVTEEGSWLIPSNYWQVVEFLREELARADGPLAEAEGLRRSARDPLAESARDAQFWKSTADENGWRGVPVIASALQAEFCEWLGFEVVARLPRSEELTPAVLQEMLASGAQMIVANRQSDAQSADMLASRLRLPLAVLNNFPARKSDGRSAFRLLGEDNLSALEQAWRKR
jgi:zinc transport system substrate-binding protein